MINQELFIDGVLADISEDTEITLQIQSNIFRDITEIVTNNTYTVTLPKTVHNLTLIGNADKPGMQGGGFAYKYHDCEYRRNGVPIIKNGRASLTECEDGISLDIYWGLFPALETLMEEDMNLNELESDLHLGYKKYNTLTDYDTFISQGYGYAGYNSVRRTVSDSWSARQVIVNNGSTETYTLTPGKIRTGTVVGDAVSGVVEDDDNYKCLSVNFTAGHTAKFGKLCGYGEYRSYAVLDAAGNVLQIANGVYRGNTKGSAYNYNQSFSASDLVYYIPKINGECYITELAIYVSSGNSAKAVEYGIIDEETKEITKWGEITVPANKGGIFTVEFTDKVKPSGCQFYIKPSAPNILATYDDGLTDLYSYDGTTWGKVDGKNLCLTVSFQTIDADPIPQNYEVSAPATANRLIINADSRFSDSDIVVTISTISSDKALASRSAKAVTKVGGSLVQPTVTVRWLLNLIRDKTGVNFVWDTDSSDFIDSLSVPVISREADEQTITGELSAALDKNDAPKWWATGVIKLDVSSVPSSFMAATGEQTALYVLTACTLNFDVQGYVVYNTVSWSVAYNISHATYLEAIYKYYACYIVMVVKHMDDDSEADEYIIGLQDAAEGSSEASGNDIKDNRYSVLLIGSGDVNLEAGDTVTFEARCENRVWLSFQAWWLESLDINATVVQSDEVAYGGMFPIAKNLPEISIMDFIKTLNLFEGTFPLQKFANDTVTLKPFDTIWENKANAVDWSDRLIAKDNTNKPRHVEFVAGDYYQHNLYSWKEDDKTYNNYDGDLRIDNATLEKENDTWELPFAASDGNRVPIFDYTKKDATGDGEDATVEIEYDECEPRIMTVYKDADNKAALTFGIDLQEIFDTKYAKLASAVSTAFVITEHLYLSDLEIMNFDETIPVYLRQYGACFAVTELEVSSDGYTKATMIKINF